MVTVSEAFSIALSFHEAGRLAEAESIYRQILAADPSNISTLSNLALITDPVESMALLKTAVLYNPTYFEGHLRLGHYLKAEDKLEEAFACYDRAIHLWPDHPEAQNALRMIENLGPTLQEQGRLDEAILCFTLLLRHKPEHVEIIRRLATSYYLWGRIDEAVACLERCIALIPDSVEVHRELLHILQAHGRFGEMEAACRRIMSSGPPHIYFMALTMLGLYLERQNRQDEALALYEQAVNLVSGHAFSDTRRRVLLVRRAWGPPPAPLERRPGPYITMSSLGSNGRFGNQIVQYAFLRIYAHVHALGWEAPDWIGRDMFGLDDPYISEPLPVVRENDLDFSSFEALPPEKVINRDVMSFRFFSPLTYSPYKDFYRSIFTFSENARRAVEPALTELRRRADTVVAIHLRRGDICNGHFWIAPESYYLEWLHELWPTLENPVLYIATDGPEVIAAFSAFSPLTGADFPPPPPGVEFLVDYAVLIDADILATSKSSFSYTAALLNTHGRLFMQPCERQQKLLPYDPWSDPG